MLPGGNEMRLVFFTYAAFKAWWQAQSPERYVVYYTAADEVILRPSKATETLDYGYIRFSNPEDAQEAVQELREAGFPVFYVGRVEWDVQRSVSAGTD
jgi:hypothetical protein